MAQDIRSQITSVISKTLSGLNIPGELPAVIIDIPAETAHGEFTCNIAMQLSRALRKNPLEIADQIVKGIEANLKGHPLESRIKKVEVKKPGFINFFLSNAAFYDILYQIFKENKNYGASNYGQGKKTLVEFVSANPTGPLTVAHGRQAVVGDSLVNILNAAGFKAVREYYINDEGNQINSLGASVRIRAEQRFADRQIPDAILQGDYYQGDYITDIAKSFIKDFGIKSEDQLKPKEVEKQMARYAVDYLMAMIKKDLEDFGVHFDIWTSQAKVATNDAIEKVLRLLKNKDFIYEREGAQWFKSTAFGDDKDRVVQKSDGTYTYLMPDVVYHKNKFERGFDWVIDFLGPDHHGYIPRLKAAAGALGRNPDDIHIEIIQLATIYRDGKPVSMSTRRGEFITLREVIDEVGKDAGRFFFLMRQTSAHLDFDLELAKKAAPENPVYYIQYAHARINSVVRKAKEESQLKPRHSNLKLLVQEEELELIRKLSHFGDILITCSKQTDPFSLVRYLQELAAAFHKFYDRHRVIDENKELSQERLALINATRIVIANGLALLGITAPERM